MTEKPIRQAEEREIPRWVQVPVGLALALFTLLGCVGSGMLLVSPPEKNRLFGATLGLVLLLGCFWVLEKCFRLLTGRKYRGGLMSPRALRAISVALLVLPVCGLFTGYYRTMGDVAIVQLVAYVAAFFRLRALARTREEQESEIMRETLANPDPPSGR
jgi:heme A synthase